MKKLLMLGILSLGLCTIGQTIRAGDDGPDDSYRRRVPERASIYDEPYAAYPRCYPPPPVFFRPPPRILFYGRPHYRRHYYPYAYGFGPGIHIGIGF